MGTKERILATALELYNSQGIHAITSRHIAAKMAISPGNLHYHFKHTDDIIHTLYKQLAAEFDVIMEEVGGAGKADLQLFYDYSHRSFELVYKYRFILLNFVEIGLRIPAIKKHYHTLTERRSTQFKVLFKQLQSGNIFRSDLPESVWETLVIQIFIVADFWLSNNELTVKLKGQQAVSYYSAVFQQMFYPYLTPVAVKKMMK